MAHVGSHEESALLPALIVGLHFLPSRFALFPRLDPTILYPLPRV